MTIGKCQGCEELEKRVMEMEGIVKNLGSEMTEVKHEVEIVKKEGDIRDEQHKSLMESVRKLEEGQNRMEKNQSAMLEKVIDKQDKLIEALTNNSERKDNNELADRKSERELVLEQDKLDLDRKKFLWGNFFKIVISALALIGAYYGIVIK